MRGIRFILVVLVFVAVLLPGERVAGRTPDDCDGGAGASFGFYVNIRWQEGRERLSVDVCPSAGLGWVLAIPAATPDVRVGWGSAMPVFRGRTPGSQLHERLAQIPLVARATQLYPLIFEVLFMPATGYSAEIDKRQAGNSYGCKVVAAATVEELERAAREVGIVLSREERTSLGDKVDGGHCFVMVWSKVPRTKEEVSWPFGDLKEDPCLEVEFPASVPVLPMRAVGGQEEARFDAYNACLNDYVELIEPLPEDARPRLMHFRGVALAGSGGKDLEPYTRLMFQGASREVHFTPVEGAAFVAMDRGYGLWEWVPLWVVIVVWVACCSYVSGGVAGMVVARRWRAYARMGLWNLTTLVGLRLRLGSGRWAGMMDEGRRRWFLLIFTGVFVGINCSADGVLWMWLGRYSAGW